MLGPNKIEFEFYTPLGLVKKYSNGVVLIHVSLLEITISDLEKHYVLLSEHLAGPKYPFILTFENQYLKMSALTRRYNNDMMNYWSTAMGVVVTGPLINIFVSIYLKINPLHYDIKVCSNIDEAFQFLEDFRSLKLA